MTEMLSIVMLATVSGPITRRLSTLKNSLKKRKPPYRHEHPKKVIAGGTPLR